VLRRVAGITEHTGRVMTEEKPKLNVSCKKKKKKKKKTQDEAEEEEEEKPRGMMMQKKQLQQLRNSENRWQAWEQKSLPIADDLIKVQVDGKTGAANQAGNPRKQSKPEKTKETYHDIMRFFANGVRGYGKSSCFPYATLSHFSFFFNFFFPSSFFLFFSLLPNLSYYHGSSAFSFSFFKWRIFAAWATWRIFFPENEKNTNNL